MLHESGSLAKIRSSSSPYPCSAAVCIRWPLHGLTNSLHGSYAAVLKVNHKPGQVQKLVIGLCKITKPSLSPVGGVAYLQLRQYCNMKNNNVAIIE